MPKEPTHFVACLLEEPARQRMWAALRAGHTPAEAIAETGLSPAPQLQDAAQLPPDAEGLPEGATP